MGATRLAMSNDGPFTETVPLEPAAGAQGVPALEPGARVDRYELVRLAGKGGMGQVFVARDTKLHRVVALKLLRPERTRGADRELRLLQEARTMAQVKSPFVVAVYDGDVEVERHPQHRPIAVTVPGAAFTAQHWRA